MIKPVSPSIAAAPPPDTDASIERVNAELSKPWTAYDRSWGRCLGRVLLGMDPDHVAGIFRREGWTVEYTAGQRDGDFYRFKGAAS